MNRCRTCCARPLPALPVVKIEPVDAYVKIEQVDAQVRKGGQWTASSFGTWAPRILARNASGRQFLLKPSLGYFPVAHYALR